MQSNRLPNNKFRFLVEGECEERYLKYLQNLINADKKIKETVSFEIVVGRKPQSVVKRIPTLGNMVITQLVDYESKEQSDENTFKATLDDMHSASKLKTIKFALGYTNLTFELWLIWHKRDWFGRVSTKEDYLKILNQAYGTDFESLRKYKQKDNFQKILNKITISDVIDAIQRAEATRKKNEKELRAQVYKKYRYFRDNPDSSVQESIKMILSKAGLL